ncbi:MAG: hypothetical protein IT366_11605 [Candidatus Hydrogenedentes bacterium]|nr:hypothetical protein [Candidatus Hydrogenedentota bacterium]
MNWEDEPPASTPSLPLNYGRWSGPYNNMYGKRWVSTVNKWFRQGTAAGLWQDRFRSFDKGHSSIPLALFPQLEAEDPVTAFGPSLSNVLVQHVTFGVQSYGMGGQSVAESLSRSSLRAYYENGTFRREGHQHFRMVLYERNFLFVAPAVDSYGVRGDQFTFLSPFYLHSVGRSGSDARLLQPILLAAAALPPKLKTRMLRCGVYVPTLMQLFKGAIAGDISSANAHLPAYSLPDEAKEGNTGRTPFLDRLITTAHDLTHIPPVCRFAIEPVYVKATGKFPYGGKAYWEKTPYAFFGALREGQEFQLEIDLRDSWVDDGFSLKDFYTAVLRGPGTIEKQNSEGSRLRIHVPWTVMDMDKDYRTDILLLVSDGTYFSAPAYISIRHVHKLDPMVLGLRR